MRNRFLVAAMLSLCWLPLLAAPGGEQLRYRVSYKGIFSAGSEVSIANAVLRTRQPAQQSPYLESELAVTSAPYGYVENLYPIRYRFRSWYWRDFSAALASEYFEYGRADDVEHKLIYLDSLDKPFITRKLRPGKQFDLELLRNGAYQPASSRGERRVFDRLGLLQSVRGQTLRPGQEIEAQVSNGSKMLRYRVKVEAAVPLRVAGRDWSALKLRFDGFERDKRGNEEHAHRPVYIWLSADDRHIPLLALSKHALGRFRIELTSAQAPTRVASSSD
jgi:hypothetical protein